MKKSCVSLIMVCLMSSLAGATAYLTDFFGGERVTRVEPTVIGKDDGIMTKHVTKKVLKNGMTILVREAHNIPRVSTQLWYNVGSKDEETGEYGIAHLIEHMIFKGTEKLSESDINIISHKLSGEINAFTSYDYTGYRFDFPTRHWREALPIFADCMQNVSFKDDHLNSEMKAVIQELKLGRDNYVSDLIYKMITAIFADHPYHNPIIGYKQDLWSVRADDLRAFYKKHYHPNNATLIIVGDVDTEEVFDLAEKQFAAIAPQPDYKKREFYFTQDIASTSVTIYRDIQQPHVLLSFVVPGFKDDSDEILDLISLLAGSGKGSRLYRKLVDELQLATAVGAEHIGLFEHSLFFIILQPKDISKLPEIENVVHEELASLAAGNFKDHEFTRALSQARKSHYHLLEDTQKQAYYIGHAYLATGDPDYVFKYLERDAQELKKDVQRYLTDYFRPAIMHRGLVLPLAQKEKAQWQKLQQESDALDNKILSAHERTSPIEPPVHAQNVERKEATAFDFPKPTIFTLSNGLKVLQYHNDNVPTVELHIRLKADRAYDDEKLPGLYKFTAAMLAEGTKNYTAEQLIDESETLGMSMQAAPGAVGVSMLSEHLEKSLSLVQEVLSNPIFPAEKIDKVRAQMHAHVKLFWDEPAQFGLQLVRERVYRGHPYGKNNVGTPESVAAITRDDLVNFYKKYLSPYGATVSIVGNFDGVDIKALLEKTLGQWQGAQVADLDYPALTTVQPTDVEYFINRDQIFLAFAGLSVERTHPDYDKLDIFNQIFSAGKLGSLASRLFQLREQSGLFYAIGGNLASGADEQPGMVLVVTKVSKDRLDEAEKAIKDTIDTAVNQITDDELAEARAAIHTHAVSCFESNGGMAKVFSLIDKYNFPQDYFDTLAQRLAGITKEDIQEAVRKVLSSKQMLTLRVGRVGTPDSPQTQA